MTNYYKYLLIIFIIFFVVSCQNKKTFIYKFNNDPFLISALNKKNQINSIKEILSKIALLKSRLINNVEFKDINKLNDWVITENKLHHVKNKFFNVQCIVGVPER